MALEQSATALATLSDTIAAVVPVLTAAGKSEANVQQLDSQIAGQINQLNGQLTPFVPAPAATTTTATGDGSTTLGA